MVKRGPNLTAEQKTTIRMMYHDQGEKPEDIAVYLPQRGVGGGRESVAQKTRAVYA